MQNIFFVELDDKKRLFRHLSSKIEFICGCHSGVGIRNVKETTLERAFKNFSRSLTHNQAFNGIWGYEFLRTFWARRSRDNPIMQNESNAHQKFIKFVKIHEKYEKSYKITIRIHHVIPDMKWQFHFDSSDVKETTLAISYAWYNLWSVCPTVIL